MTTNSSVGQSDNALADKAAVSADAAIQSARQKAHHAFDGLSDTVKSVKNQATATLERLRPKLESVTAYTKEEPTKALLIAAAAGAGVMAVVALVGRSGGGGRRKSSSSSEALRRAVQDLTDNIRKSARDAADSASAKADGALKSTRSTAKAAFEGLTDTVQQLKDQAAPIVDRGRAQIDGVMTYTKEDPAKALMIAAAAGAALMGLMRSISR